MPIQMTLNKGLVPVKIYTKDLDSQALDQLANMSKLPIVHNHIAAMPDVHAGRGATVGSVIPTKNAIIPAAVGVDIGCGMSAVRLSLNATQLPDNLRSLRTDIERSVPVGFSMHKERSVKASTLRALDARLNAILTKHPGLLKMVRNFPHTWPKQLGTLGGGNHFIEVCLDETDQVWVMLHSGSRGIGNAIGRYFISLARKDMGRQIQNLPDKDLAYLTAGSDHFEDYVEALNWAQDYAYENRREMLRLTLAVLSRRLPEFRVLSEAIDCHHNYVSKETHFGSEVLVTRKGAIRAGLDELGIIPGSMGHASYIVRGLGSREAFDSCAHGAGRRMGRMEAKRTFTLRDLAEQTEGVECRKDKSVLDEAPGAYKDIDEVMLNQSDLVDVVYKLKQVLCIKG